MKKAIRSIICIVLCLSMLPITSFAAYEGLHNFKQTHTYRSGQFTDIAAGAWYEETVGSCYEIGLMNGNSATTFNPKGNITTAETLTIVARIHKIYNTGSDDFSDIKQEMLDMESTILEWCDYDKNSPAYKEFYNAWYAPYVYYCFSYIWPEGRAEYPQFPALAYNTYYAPFIDTKTSITRERFVSYLVGALPESEFNEINAVPYGAIPDVDYSPDTYMLYRAGILTGNDDKGTFAPTSNITRAEVATIISRMVKPTERKVFSLSNVGSNINAAGDILTDVKKIEMEVKDTFTINITYYGYEELWVYYDDTVVQAEWGEWDSFTIPLTITALKNGYSELEICAENDEESCIYVDVYVGNENNSDDEYAPMLVTYNNGYEIHYEEDISNPIVYQEAATIIGKYQLKYPAMAKEAYDRIIMVHRDEDDPKDIVVFGWWLGCNAFGVYDYVGYIVTFNNGDLGDYDCFAF